MHSSLYFHKNLVRKLFSLFFILNELFCFTIQFGIKMSLEQYIDLLTNVVPHTTFANLNAHFHQLERHYPNYTLNFVDLCENAQLDTTQLLKISYIVSLIQTKLHNALSNGHAHFFFSRVDDFSDLVAEGHRILNSRPLSPCTVAVASEDLLAPHPTQTPELHQQNDDKFKALCFVARRSNP